MDMQDINRRVIEQFRAGGEVEGMHRDRLLLLTNAGATKAPDWYVNLVANPAVRVEIGDETYPATATVLAGAERARLWAEITSANPFFIDHEKKAERQIPVVALARA